MYKKAHVHFVGIGGIGMSGIATILKHQGYRVSGCDCDMDQKSVHDLKSIGCQVYQGNNTPECHDPSIDILVYSSAIKDKNPEILAAQERGIPTIPRALMLAELMRTKFSIAIAGAHGKTTTTSLISHILIEAKQDPTVIIGGHLKTISTNARYGDGNFLVAEADESDRTLERLHATLAVVTNIDLEHLETYTDIEDIKATFRRFLYNLPFYGKAILCVDDPQIRALFPLPHLKVIKYGLDDNADIYAPEMSLSATGASFPVFEKNNQLGHIHLNMLGRHNALNALAAIAVTRDLGLPFETIAAALESFPGVERRFSLRGTYKGAEVFDDYGHHPVEIANTIASARTRTSGPITVIFQPHRYTRTDKLWDSFVNMFLHSSIDHLIITDIYPASEAAIPGITSERLVQAIREKQPRFDVTYLPLEEHFTNIRSQLDSIKVENGLILLQGAGKINKLAYELV